MNQDLEYDDEEQKWEQEELTGLEEDEVEEASSRYRAYIPQLMDIQQMRALRTALDRSEMQILQQGHLKEYVPRKPASSKLRQWYGLPRNHRGINRPIMSAGPSSRIESLNADSKLCERPATSSRSASTGVKTKEFAMIMKRETRQARELERLYEDTKRSLLDYVEVVTTCKPNDRVGGPEVYEQLADLISFAAKCSRPE